MGQGFDMTVATSLVGARFIVPSFYFSRPAGELSIRKVPETAR